MGIFRASIVTTGFLVLEWAVVCVVLSTVMLSAWKMLFPVYTHYQKQAVQFSLWQTLHLIQLQAQVYDQDLQCRIQDNQLVVWQRAQKQDVYAIEGEPWTINHRGVLGFKASGYTQYAGSLYLMSDTRYKLTVSIGMGRIRRYQEGHPW